MLIVIAGCQSMDKTAAPDKDRDKFETRKQIVINSLDSGQSAQALNDARLLAQEYPKDPAVLNLLGLAHLSLKNSAKAVEALEKAASIDRDNITYNLNLSSALIQAGRYDAANTLLDRCLKAPAISAYKYKERIYHNLGLVAELTGRSVRAENFYNKALAENPTNFLTLIKLSRIYESTHRRILAADKLETARAACPRCLEPVEGLVRIYMGQKKPNIARSVVEAMEKNEGLTEQETKRILELKKIVSKGTTQTRS
jgi:Tfp pilus assembly protein PilF